LSEALARRIPRLFTTWAHEEHRETRTFAELLIDAEEKATGALLVGMLWE